jgi:hypothetical protein
MFKQLDISPGHVVLLLMYMYVRIEQRRRDKNEPNGFTTWEMEGKVKIVSSGMD